jgi:hypothetical protein
MSAFRERLDLMQASGQLSSQVRETAEAIVAELDAVHGPLTEDNAGMLVSHLALSLQRLQQGTSLEPDPLVVEEAAQYPEELALAGRIAGRAAHLGAGPLPAGEVGFLAIHIRALREAEREG